MLREKLRDALKAALKSHDACGVATLRLILAALKDRDIAARSKGDNDCISDEEIVSMMQTMVRQRGDSITLFERGGRVELAEQERSEIAVIGRFLPRQLDEGEIRKAVAEAIAQTSACNLKDMGKVMTVLREGHGGGMNFGKASEVAKELLSAA